MNKLVIRDKEGRVTQTVNALGKIEGPYDPDKHLDALCLFFGIGKAGAA